MASEEPTQGSERLTFKSVAIGTVRVSTCVFAQSSNIEMARPRTRHPSGKVRFVPCTAAVPARLARAIPAAAARDLRKPISGVIIPKMGTTSKRLSEALFSKTQRRVLGLLFGHPERSYYANEIVRFAGAGVGAVYRELQGLAASGLVTVSHVGNQKHYRANRDSPIFEELRGIVLKVLGPAADRVEVSRARAKPGALAATTALEQPRAGYDAGAGSAGLNVPARKLAAMCRRYGVKKLSLFGSAARGELTPGSDVDLMVEFKPESRVSLWDFPKLQEEFSALFGHRRVELVPPEVMKNPFRRKTILPDLRVLYEG